MDASETDSGGLRLRVAFGSGWGVGITFKPVAESQTHPDGSVDLAGARRVKVILDAPAGIRFSMGLQESGHGPAYEQTYAGYAGADGESYTTPEVTTVEGRQTYTFRLDEMSLSPSYGNQRGNSRIDTPAIAQCHLFFPGNQATSTLLFLSIEFD